MSNAPMVWRRPVTRSREQRRDDVTEIIVADMKAYRGGPTMLPKHLGLIDELGLSPVEAKRWKDQVEEDWRQKEAERAKPKEVNDNEGPEIDPALSVSSDPKSKLKPSELLINPRAGRQVSTEVIQRAMVRFNPAKNPFSQNAFENARIALELMGFDCGYDLFHHKPKIMGEYAWLGGEGLEDLDNVVLKLRQRIMDEFGFDPKMQGTLDALKARCLDHSFNPLLDYFARLEWDGKPRLDTWLMTYAQAEDNPLNRAFGRKALIAAVRRAKHPGCKFDYLLVIEGKQGWGKSTLVKILAGGDDYYCDSPIIGLASREQQEAIQGVWLYEIGELEGLSKADVGWMKMFLSRTHDKARPAFGRSVVNRPRSGIMIGTTNDPHYLRDTTGNRRWWPVKLLGAIDLDGVQRDRNQLWAEAIVAEATDETLVLPQELWDAAAVEQNARMELDAWEEPISKRLQELERKRTSMPGEFWSKDCDKQGSPEFRVSSAFLLDEVLKIEAGYRGQRETKRLANVMRTLGWELASSPIKLGGHTCRAYTKLQPPKEGK